MSKVEVYSTSDKKIVFIDVLLTIIAVSAVLIHTKALHPAICIVLGIVAGCIIYVLFRTRIGFWIVSVLFSALFGIFGGAVVYTIAKKDNTWGIVSGVIIFLVVMSMHSLARRFFDNVDD